MQFCFVLEVLKHSLHNRQITRQLQEIGLLRSSLLWFSFPLQIALFTNNDLNMIGFLFPGEVPEVIEIVTLASREGLVSDSS